MTCNYRCLETNLKYEVNFLEKYEAARVLNTALHFALIIQIKVICITLQVLVVAFYSAHGCKWNVLERTAQR